MEETEIIKKEKVCTHCGRLLPLSMFTYRSKEHLRLSSWCRDCQKAKTKEIRITNPDYYKAKDKENNKISYKNKRVKINEFKKGGCIICGEKEPVCLDFHHINPSEKSFEIGKQFHIKGFEAIKQEINKCVCLCANCHRKVHAGIIKL